MINALKRGFKSTVPVLPDSHIVTSLGVRMRSPFKDGKWIGWTGAEIAEHFSAVNSFKSSIRHKEDTQIPLKEKCEPPLKEDYNNCGRG